MIEAMGQQSLSPAWRYALTRLAHAEMHVGFDDREVWQCPRVESTRPSEPYHLVIETAGGQRPQ
jgi:hypothetical protein